MAIIAVARRRDRVAPGASAGVGTWVALALVAYLLSLGPALHLDGVALTGSVLPYHWLEVLLPPLRLSGCPSRISVVLALAVAILASIGTSALLQRGGRRSMMMLVAFAMVMVIDLWPTPFTVTPVLRPAWAMALRDLPLEGAVISRAYDDPGAELYCQTLYERPMAFGYISRVPTSAYRNDARVLMCARSGDIAALRRDLGFVYVVLRRNMAVPGLPIAYSDDRVVIQELAEGHATESATASSRSH